MIIVEQSVSLEAITPNAERLIERAARCCYQSEGLISENSAAMLIKKCIERGHESVLEHASATFRIITDRGITHEIVRHRLASYSQESTRYVKYGEMRVVAPLGLSKDESFVWEMLMNHIEQSYGKLLCTQPPQVARDVLPTCLKTELWMTANFREWRHFIKLRAAKAAHPKIQIIARSIHADLHLYAPNVFPCIS